METPFVSGGWLVEPGLNRISRGDREVRLEPRVMALLCELAGAGGEVLLRDELRRRVWEGVHTGDDALSVAIYQLRRALGDQASAPRFIRTVPKRGYQWLSPIEPCGSSTNKAPQDGRSGVSEVSTLADPLGAESPALSDPLVAERPTPTEPLIVEGPAPNDPVFVEFQRAQRPSPTALSEGESRRRWLTLFRGSGVAAAVLIGAVGGLAHWRASDGAGDDKSTELPPLASSVQALLAAPGMPNSASHLTFRQGEDENAAPAAPRAFRVAYLRGWHLLNKGGRKQVEAAREHFRRAIEIAPDSATAHASLAAAHCIAADIGIASREKLEPDAARALARAVALDANTATTEYAAGLYSVVFHFELKRAAEHIQRAIALEPGHYRFHTTLAWVRTAQGQTSEAIVHARRALEADPTSTHAHTALARFLANDWRFGDAADTLREALELDPDSTHAMSMLAWVLEHLGRDHEAYNLRRRLFLRKNASEAKLSGFERAWQEGGLHGVLRWRAERFLSRVEADPNVLPQLAALQARLGDHAKALENLHLAHQSGHLALPYILDSPDFTGLRGDSHFAALVAQVRAEP